MVQLTPELLKRASSVQRYGLAVVAVAVALGAALLVNRYSFRGVEFPLFLFAIAVSAWYAGPRPAILTLVLSSLAFNYFFTEPFYSFYVARADVPYLVVFHTLCFACGLVQQRSAHVLMTGPRVHAVDPGLGETHGHFDRRLAGLLENRSRRDPEHRG